MDKKAFNAIVDIYSLNIDTNIRRNMTNNISSLDLAITQNKALRNLQQLQDRLLSGSSLRQAEWMVLAYAARQKPGCRVGDIAAALEVQSTYITGILRRLETKKLIKVGADSKDRRARRVSATKKGDEVIHEIDQTSREIWDKIAEGCQDKPEALMTQYSKVLDKIAAINL